MESSSIGIIGGADGPTAVFVTAGPGFKTAALILIAGVVVLTAYFIYRFFKKRKR